MVNCEGWTCPTCRRNYAPWMPSCNCINSAVGVSTTSITITPHTDDTAELVEAVEAYFAAEDHLDATMDDRYEVSDTRAAAEAVIRRKDELRQALAQVRGGA